MRAIAWRTIAWLGELIGSEWRVFTYESLDHWGRGLRTAATELLERQYWTRVWVIQEFILPREVQIWCGNYSTTPERLIKWISWMNIDPSLPGWILLQLRNRWHLSGIRDGSFGLRTLLTASSGQTCQQSSQSSRANLI